MNFLNSHLKKFSIIYVLVILMLCSFFTGCREVEVIKNTPVNYLLIPDIRNNVCSLFVINDKTTLSAKRQGSLPLMACDGIVGLYPKEFLDLKTYMKQMIYNSKFNQDDDEVDLYVQKNILGLEYH